MYMYSLIFNNVVMYFRFMTLYRYTYNIDLKFTKVLRAS